MEDRKVIMKKEMKEIEEENGKWIKLMEKYDYERDGS